MSHRALALLLAAPLLTACGQEPDPDLVHALRGAAAPALFAPELQGDEPRSFLVNSVDESVSIDYGKGFTPTITLRPAPQGDLCDARDREEWDRCWPVDDNAVVLGFEEMNAIVVRRDGTELFVNNLSFETEPDAVKAASPFIEDIRDSPELSAEEFVSALPKGRVGTP